MKRVDHLTYRDPYHDHFNPFPTPLMYRKRYLEGKVQCRGTNVFSIDLFNHNLVYVHLPLPQVSLNLW